MTDEEREQVEQDLAELRRQREEMLGRVNVIQTEGGMRARLEWLQRNQLAIMRLERMLAA